MLLLAMRPSRLLHCTAGAATSPHTCKIGIRCCNSAQYSGGNSSSSSSSKKESGRRQPSASELWRATVEGADDLEPDVGRRGVVSSLKTWLSTRFALHHCKSVAPSARAEGRFDNLRGQVAEGAGHCLHFLAESLHPGHDGKCRMASPAFGRPLVEEALAEQLRRMTLSLQGSGHSWHWQLENVLDAHIQRLFLIIAASRSGTVRRGPTDILCAFGQQFVLTRDQTKRFLDRSSGIQNRMEVFKELLYSDLVLVADASLTVRQSSALITPSKQQPIAAAAAAAAAAPQAQVTKHLLRLEMPLSQERNYDDDGVPLMQTGPWQIADWNWICFGNHPMLPRDHPAPW